MKSILPSFRHLVFLRDSPLGIHKIQHAWSPTVYKVVDIQGTAHTVEPFEGSPIKRVHRSELLPCAKPVPKLRTKTRVQPSTKPVAEDVPESPGPDFVVVEEVLPQLVQTANLPRVADRVDLPVATPADEGDSVETFEGHKGVRKGGTEIECVGSDVHSDVVNCSLQQTGTDKR